MCETAYVEGVALRHPGRQLPARMRALILGGAGPRVEHAPQLHAPCATYPRCGPRTLQATRCPCQSAR